MPPKCRNLLRLLLLGGAAPKGKKMGHAGAIVMGDKGTFASKASALSAAGVNVLATPSHVGDALREGLES